MLMQLAAIWNYLIVILLMMIGPNHHQQDDNQIIPDRGKLHQHYE